MDNRKHKSYKQLKFLLENWDGSKSELARRLGYAQRCTLYRHMTFIELGLSVNPNQSRRELIYAEYKLLRNRLNASKI